MLLQTNNTELVTQVSDSPLAGLMPIVYSVALIIIIFSAIAQLRKGFTISKFIPWLLCAGIVGLMILNPSILAQIGGAVWNVVVSIVSGIKITKV